MCRLSDGTRWSFAELADAELDCRDAEVDCRIWIAERRQEIDEVVRAVQISRSLLELDAAEQWMQVVKLNDPSGVHTRDVRYNQPVQETFFVWNKHHQLWKDLKTRNKLH